jgi:hypothetical protein
MIDIAKVPIARIPNPTRLRDCKILREISGVIAWSVIRWRAIAKAGVAVAEQSAASSFGGWTCEVVPIDWTVWRLG